MITVEVSRQCKILYQVVGKLLIKMKGLIRLQNIGPLGANYDELTLNIKNEAPFTALTGNWFKIMSNLSTNCQDTNKNKLTGCRQRGKSRGVAVMCREKTKMHSFMTNLHELQSVTVKLTFRSNRVNNSL